MATPPMPDILPAPTQVETSSSGGDSLAPPSRPVRPPFGFPPGWPPFHFKSVRPGAWMLNYIPVGSPLVAYDGTIRVEAIPGGRRASGDLYQRPTIRVPSPFPPPRGPGTTIMLPPPNPANGIPIQAISKYRYYLRVTKILENVTIGNSFELGLQMFLFTPTANGAGTWSPPSPSAINCTATMTWMPAPAGYPSSSDYLEGDLKQDGANVTIGRLKMGWLSKFFRKATIEIDTITGSELPLNSGNGHDWQSVGESMGYELKVHPPRERDIPEASSES